MKSATNPMGENDNRPELSVGTLRDFSAALIGLAELAPERATISQMTFFLLAGAADLAGRPATFTEIRDEVGPTISKSLHTTYQVFLDRPRKRSDTGKVTDGLGWLERQEDPDDYRKKYLRLTPRGREVLRDLLAKIDGRRAAR